ncbi:MAG: hypothetical protein ACXABD_22700 [Candidatus Thorarchaeota archaeon]|jgi:hypothetical protein
MNEKVKFKQDCTICSVPHWNDELEFLPIYTIGSEGTWICHPCKMAVTQFCRALMSASGRGQSRVLKRVAHRLEETQEKIDEIFTNEER